jgi:hypothetical protein
VVSDSPVPIPMGDSWSAIAIHGPHLVAFVRIVSVPLLAPGVALSCAVRAGCCPHFGGAQPNAAIAPSDMRPYSDTSGIFGDRATICGTHYFSTSTHVVVIWQSVTVGAPHSNHSVGVNSR